MKTLQQIQAELSVKVPDEAQFALLNTRLILRTGVNLANFRPDQANNPATVGKVMAALAAMGFDLR